MHAHPRLVGFGLATASGCLWFLACTPFDWWPLAWVASVPMLIAVERARTLRGALFLGWWAGVVETAGGFHWLIDTTQRFTELPWIVAVLVFALFCATRAIIFLLFTGVVRGLSSRALPMALIAPLALVVSEWSVPQLFPCGQWITQAWHPLVIQITELTGPLGVSALLMVVNGALYDLIAAHRAARVCAAAAAALVGAALLYGAVRMRQVDAAMVHAPRLKVGLVQPNFAYTAEGIESRDEAVRELSALREQSRLLARQGAELVVWSEGSYPVALPRDFNEDFEEDSEARIRQGFDVPVLFGANTVESEQGDAWNTALLLDHKGRVSGRYDKVKLLAFGETVPGVDLFPWLQNLLPAGSSRFRAGTGPGVLTLEVPGKGTWHLGTLICYEDLLPEFIGRTGELYPDLLVNLTSDQWFGAGTEPYEHLALSVFGAIELRVALARAVNSGISALIDPNGRIVARTYADDPYRDPRPSDGMLVAAPKMAGGHTLFVAWGDWFAYACLLAAAALAIGRRRMLRRVAGVRRPGVAAGPADKL